MYENHFLTNIPLLEETCNKALEMHDDRHIIDRN